jgi:hypothetical protein
MPSVERDGGKEGGRENESLLGITAVWVLQRPFYSLENLAGGH